MSRPNREQIQETLAAAGQAHHQYETEYLGGERDENWPAWYAAYVLGRLGDFMTPNSLTRCLEGTTGDGDWNALAAESVFKQL